MSARSVAGLLAGAAALAWWIAARPPVISVPGDYATVAAALAAAPEGAVVLLEAGTYRESLEIDRPVSLEGRDGEAVIAGRPDDPAVSVFGTRGVTIRGLTITGGEVGVLVRESEDVLIEDNRIEGNRWRGVRVVLGSARIVDNEVSGTAGAYGKGIHVANSMSRPPTVIAGNLVEGNAGEGIVTNLARVEIRANTVRDNGVGISVAEMSMASVLDSTVAGNDGPAIAVIDMSSAELEGNQVAGEVSLQFHAQARLLANRISADGCPISTANESAVFLHRNTVSPAPPRCASPQLLTPAVEPISPRAWQVVMGTAVALLLLPVLVSAPGHSVPWVFLTALVVQVLHQGEHVVQVVQAHLLHLPQAHGLAGAVLDTEWVHLGFNSVLTVAMAAILIGRRGAGLAEWRRRSTLALGALVVTVAVQGYHQVEHMVKIGQHLTTGATPAPGLLGHTFELVWLHFSINLAVTAGLAVAFLGLRVAGDLRLRTLGRLHPEPA